MGGKGSGRPRKPTALHIREGTYNVTDHRDRADLTFEDSEPTRLTGLGNDGRYLWQLIVESTPKEVLKRLDSAALFAMCRWWEHYRKLDRSLGKKMDSKIMRECSRAYSNFERMAKEFGLSPVARARLRNDGGKPPAVNDPLAAMAGKRGA